MTTRFYQQNINAVSLMSEAVAESGLEDFGDTWIQPHLDRLLSELDTTANLSAQGCAVMTERFRRLLITRLRFQQQLLKFPEINKETVESPVIIIGLPRTGTTKLHRMLAASGDFTTLPLWQTLEPVIEGKMSPEDTARRKQAGDDYCKLLKENSPEIMQVHEMDVEEPEEEILLMQHSFLTKITHTESYVPGFNEYVDTCDNKPVYQELKQWMKYLQWQQGGTRKPWLLKAVYHNEFLEELLHAFPDARLIQIHRKVPDVISSWSSLIEVFRKVYSDSVDPRRIGPDQLSYWLKIMTRNMQIRDAREDIEVKDLLFTDVVRNMQQVIDEIYDFSGVLPSDISRTNMLNWEGNNAQHKFGKHDYSAEKFGLTDDIINRAFSVYRQRYGV